MRVALSLAVVVLVASSALGCKDGPPTRAAEVATPSATSEVAAPSTAPPSSVAAAPAVAAPASDACQKDADCTLSTFAGCCSCCPCGPLRAMTTSREASMKEACERKDCRSCKDFVGDCIGCQDPAKEGMHARCIASACTLVETKSGAAPPPSPASASTTVACKSDDECWLDDGHHPIARPARERGKKIRPCKDGEHAPACRDGACMVHHYKC